MGQARKDVASGDLYLNSARIIGINRSVTVIDFVFRKYLLLKEGKRTYAVLIYQAE
jgi:tyrosyl-tRNA synthetase